MRKSLTVPMESTASYTSFAKLTRAFVCSPAFYILIEFYLRSFIFHTVSDKAYVTLQHTVICTVQISTHNTAQSLGQFG